VTRMSRRAPLGRRPTRMRHCRDLGFTVLELIVVLAMLAVVLGIGIPTFINYLNSSSNATAQANIMTALQVANTYYQEQSSTYAGLCDNANCSGGSAGGFQAIEGNTLTAVPSNVDSSGPQNVSIWVSNNGGEVILAALANGPHNCWVIISDKYGKGLSLGARAPVLWYVREKRNKKQTTEPTCNAGALVYTSAIPDVTKRSLSGFPSSAG
jgi:prepilin-type N-terminal cleavage/methylation domain-containing protein